MKLKSLNRKIIVHRMRAVENADGVSGLEAECEIDLHFYIFQNNESIVYA